MLYTNRIQFLSELRSFMITKKVYIACQQVLQDTTFKLRNLTMSSDNREHIDDNLTNVEQDIDEDESFLGPYRRPILVVSIFVLGILLSLCTAFAICNVICQRCKEKIEAERQVREERRLRNLRASFSPPQRYFLPNTSPKRFSPRASNTSPPVSTHSSASYRRNFERQNGPSIGSDNSFQQNTSSRMTSFEDLRNCHRDIIQSNESDNHRVQEESSADDLRGFHSIFQISESNNHQEQEETSADELRSFQRSIFQSAESDIYQQQNASSAIELRSFRRRSDHQSVALDNFLQENELNASYTRCFLSRYGLGTESDNSHQQGELRDTSFDQLLNLQRTFTRTIESEDSLRKNESNATSPYELSTFRRRHDQSIHSNNPLEHDESSTSSYDPRNIQRFYQGTETSHPLQQNLSNATSSDELCHFRMGYSQNTESNNSLQQHESTYSSELLVHDRAFDFLLPITENITSRSLPESLNHTESNPECSTILKKRHSVP